ncbi:hypothetical protein MTO96_003886, partial [Rhipicephalus appendiculatus]
MWLLQPDMLSWEDCYFLAENETRPPAHCPSCKVSVICEAVYHHDDELRCATGTEDGSPVEYCYQNDKVIASDAIKRCEQHSSAIIDVVPMNEGVRNLMASLLDFTEEYWVDLKEDDV